MKSFMTRSSRLKNQSNGGKELIMKNKTGYLNILKEELTKAMGCTEPIAISYLACYLKDILGFIPDTIDVFVSGNILKNVKSVVVPNTYGMRGIRTAVAIGVIGGKKELKLECLSKITNDDILNCNKTADINHSGNIEFKEAISLALALSINNFSLGLGTSMSGINIPLATFFTFIFNLFTCTITVRTITVNHLECTWAHLYGF
jgi:hypothetical protein